MSATIDSVRTKVRDTTEPYAFSDDEIFAALNDAADWIEVQDVPTACPKYDLLQKLVAARELIAAAGAGRPTTQENPVTSVSEGNKSIAYAVSLIDTTPAYLSRLEADIADVVQSCKGRAVGRVRGGFGVIRDNY